MKRYVDALRMLCFEKQRGIAPYTLRTRFERNLYGLVHEYSKTVLGVVPDGLTQRHIEKLQETCRDSKDFELEPVRLASRVFECFTYLCDTSNWSNDGQDPRIEICRDDILTLCSMVMPDSLGPERRNFSVGCGR